MRRVIDEAAVREILAAAQLTISDDARVASLAQELDSIAHALIRDHYANRLGRRGRIRSLPKPEIRQRFHGDLVGAWAGIEGTEPPTLTYGQSGEYSGPFTRFAQAVAKMVGDHIQTEFGQSEPLWRGLIKTLRTMETKGGKINGPWTAIARAVSGDRRLTGVSAIVYDLIRSGVNSEDAISKQLRNKPREEIRSILKRLVQSGHIERQKIP